MTTATPRVEHPKSGVQHPVERLASRWQLTRGAIGRGVGSGLWFDFESVGWRPLHMVGVGEPLVALWVSGEIVTKVQRLRPWVGAGIAEASDVVELPADCELARRVTAGDEVVVA
jgi:uncharacterized membrane protein (UPF0127 family)